MKIAHLSDLHLLGSGQPSLLRYANKRLTGVANLLLRRKAAHRVEIARALAQQLRSIDVDHVVITGDFTNLAFEHEFEASRRFLEHDLGFAPHRVSLVPGNHDVYTRGAVRSQRFARWFAPYITSDLPALTTQQPGGAFPYVHLRDDIAFVGLSSAVPQPPLVAAGQLGRRQLDALYQVLHHREVRHRFPVVLIHHPPHNLRSWRRTLTNGLWDARRLQSLLRHLPHALVLHGHLHQRLHVHGSAVGPGVDVLGATSASLAHDDDHRRAAFHLYEVGEHGLQAEPVAFVYESPSASFSRRAIPRHSL